MKYLKHTSRLLNKIPIIGKKFKKSSTPFRAYWLFNLDVSLSEKTTNILINFLLSSSLIVLVRTLSSKKLLNRYKKKSIIIDSHFIREELVRSLNRLQAWLTNIGAAIPSSLKTQYCYNE